MARIAIIGAGFSGLGLGARLRQAGIEDFVILERAGSVGGTWRDNRYPGCAVDVQSHLYSYSFAPNPDWSRVYASQQEIWDYIRAVAERFGVMPHVRLHHDVTGARWDEARQRWQLETTGGPLEAQFVVSAIGPLSKRAVPAIPGLERFEGPCFHSAAWEDGQDLDGKRVAVLGTGASAAQVVPELQPRVAELLVFQRTPAWTFPRMNRHITAVERTLYRRWPVLQRLARRRQYLYREMLAFMLQRPRRTAAIETVARWRMRRQVPDPALRAKLTPSYRMGCKRIVVSDDYLLALARPNVDVITDRIERVEPKAIVTADGVEHEADAIVLATGFHPFHAADPLQGRDGIRLAERWALRREAYLGTTVAGYPNYFLLLGPNTATGHTSALLFVEAQIEYILDALRRLQEGGWASFDVRPEVMAAFNADLRHRLHDTVWTSGGCGSWYLDPDGGTSIIWPGYTRRFQRLLRAFDPNDYELRRQDGAVAATAG